MIDKAFTARGGARRTGRVFADRYHARPLTSPRAVRNCLAYAPNTWRLLKVAAQVASERRAQPRGYARPSRA